jgi:6-phosphofructokinase
MVTIATDKRSSCESGRYRRERPIARVRFAARDADFRIFCDAIAYDDQSGSDILMVLSVMGPQTSIKAAAAMLQSDVHCTINPEQIEEWNDRLGKHPSGYTIHRHRFEHNTWHMLAVAKQEGLLLKASEQALWVELRKPRFTTPLLRAWVPWLMKSLQAIGHLRNLRCFGCDSAILTTGTTEMDDAVANGLLSGKLKIK